MYNNCKVVGCVFQNNLSLIHFLDFKKCLKHATQKSWIFYGGGNSSAFLREKNIAVESTDKCTNIELFLLSEQF